MIAIQPETHSSYFHRLSMVDTMRSHLLSTVTMPRLFLQRLPQCDAGMPERVEGCCPVVTLRLKKASLIEQEGFACVFMQPLNDMPDPANDTCPNPQVADRAKR